MITLTNTNNQSCFVFESFTPIMQTIIDNVKPNFKYECSKGKLFKSDEEGRKLDMRNLMIFLTGTNLKSKEDAIIREYTKLKVEGDGDDKKSKYKFHNQRSQEMQLLDVITGTFSLMIMHLYSHMAPFGIDGKGIISEAASNLTEIKGNNDDVLSFPLHEIESKINNVVKQMHIAFIELMDHKYNTGISKMIMSKDIDIKDVEENYELRGVNEATKNVSDPLKKHKSKKSKK